MRLYCIQHGLRDRHSHFLGESEGIVAACAERGLALRLYAHRRVLPEIAAATGAVPAFRHATATALEPDPAFGVLSDYITLAAGFAADCAALTADGCGAGDVVLLPYAEAWSLHGLAQWLATLPPGARPRVAAHFVIPERNWSFSADRTRISGDASFIRHATARLRAESAGVTYAAVAPPFAAMVEALSGHPCRGVPIPMCYPDTATLARLRAEARHPPVDICLAGQFRREKGGALIAAILAGLPVGTRVAVQVNDAAGAESLADALGPAAESLEIFLHVGECGYADFYARILAAQVMLLPYAPEIYAVRSSGILAEAAACGVPVVAPGGTWLSDQIETGRAAGVVFDSHTPESILAALADADRQQAELAARAARLAPHWREHQTVAVWLDGMIAP
jgi:hypothetical protein